MDPTTDPATAPTTDPQSLPALTVVLPVHNGENFLAETLESVLAQSHPAAEVLVIDDASTDGTAAIAAAFGDRIRLVHTCHANVSLARNEALTLATTDWVAMVDHDDLWEPGHLHNLATAIARDPSADVVYSGARLLRLDPASKTFRPTPPLKFPSTAEVSAALMERCAFISSSVALKRSTILAAGGCDPYFLNLQDWDLWLRVLHRGGRFVHAPEPTLLYRVHPASRTNNPLRALRYSRDVVERNILPHLSSIGRVTHGQRVISRLEAEAALLLRENGLPGALPLMLRSIARHPFHEPRRYRIAAHMLLRGY